MDNRNFHIDTLRGLACIMLVSYHVIGSTPTNGLRISDGMYREINDILAYLRMPLFTFLSGIVYAYRPFQKGAKRFLIKKMRRLLLPMLTVGTTFAVLQTLTPGTNTSIEHWYLLHIKPVAHFWFIESLFLLFILIVFLEKIKFFETKEKFSFVLLLMSSLYLSPIGSSYFSFSGFLYLAPFFLLGMGVQRYNLLDNLEVPAKGLLILAVGVTFCLLFIGVIPIHEKRTLLGLFLGMFSCLALMGLGLKIQYLARIGVYSYSIYLFHVFFTAMTRITLNKLQLNELELIFIVSLGAGIFGPILIEKVLTKNKYAAVLFLGKPLFNKRNENNKQNQ